jgi:4-carboxymuconolactone decarboxylase
MKRPYGGKGAELARIAPSFNHYTQSVLYDDLWERPGLSKRDRSLITIAALIAMHRPDQMIGHMQTGLENGLTNEELGETIMHLAFYASWPNAMVAARKLLTLTERTPTTALDPRHEG